MAVQLTKFDIISATFTAGLLIPVPLIEESYFKSLTTYPDNLALQRRVPPAGGVGSTPPTTLGVGIELYVPQAVNFSTPAQNFQVAAGLVAGVAGGLTLVAPTTTSVPFLDVVLELITVETNPYFRFGLDEMKVDLRTVDTTLTTTVKDVNVGIPLNQQMTPNHPGIGKYFAYRFFKPFRKATLGSDVLQVRMSYPAIGGLTTNQTPSGTYRVHVIGEAISSV